MANAQDIDGSRGGVGMLLMLRFSEDGNVIDFHWFSPVNGETFRENNQFKLAITNEISVSGIEDDATYCGDVTFTVDSTTTAKVKIGSTILQPVDGIYTLTATDRPKTITVIDPFGDKMVSFRVTANKTHTGGVASCAGAAVCEICATPYGEPLSHEYDEEGVCALCGEAKAVEGDDTSEFPALYLIPILAGVFVPFIGITLALKKKKEES